MATALEAAFPLNSNWPAATVRSKLAEAMIAVFDTPDLSGEDFSIQPYPAIGVYGPDGDLTLYAFDATDTTTADDGGVSCIVVSGRRYKRSGEVIVRDAAISATTSAQPGSPSPGDTYIVPAAPSGADWASQAKTVATFTARGWMFRQPFVGMMVYVEDEDAIYHFNSAGNWVSGLPIGAIQDGSIPPKKLVHPFAILKVEDERNDPPGSPPTDGTMYQVGTSPTGAFAGQSRNIARWTGSAYEFIAPSGDGDIIYRRDAAQTYIYRSGAWVPQVSPASVVQSHYVPLTTEATNTTAIQNRISSPAITAQVGQKIRVTLTQCRFEVHGGLARRQIGVGVRIDTESAPLPAGRQILAIGATDDLGPSSSDWYVVGNALYTTSAVSGNTWSSAPGLITGIIEFDVPDASAHVYSIATYITVSGASPGGGNTRNFTGAALFEVINPGA